MTNGRLAAINSLCAFRDDDLGPASRAMMDYGHGTMRRWRRSMTGFIKLDKRVLERALSFRSHLLFRNPDNQAGSTAVSDVHSRRKILCCIRILLTFPARSKDLKTDVGGPRRLRFGVLSSRHRTPPYAGTLCGSSLENSSGGRESTGSVVFVGRAGRVPELFQRALGLSILYPLLLPSPFLGAWQTIAFRSSLHYQEAGRGARLAPLDTVARR